MIQDPNIIARFNRLDIKLDNASAMLSALYNTQAVGVSGDGYPSRVSSPKPKAADPVELEGLDNDGENCDA
jgi:hypothetical protein